MTKKPLNIKKSKRKTGPLETEDEIFWDHVAASVKPLKGHLKNRTPEIESAALLTVGGENKGLKKKTTSGTPLVHAQSPRPRPALPELSLASQPGLDKSMAKKLKKGQQQIEARIDLHGMTQVEAHRALDSFIDGSYQAARRCVLVITGKGWKADGTVGVIRTAVPRWLNEQPNRSRVLAFTQAAPKDGGEGALYVMLKRKR